MSSVWIEQLPLSVSRLARFNSRRETHPGTPFLQITAYHLTKRSPCQHSHPQRREIVRRRGIADQQARRALQTMAARRERHGADFAYDSGCDMQRAILAQGFADRRRAGKGKMEGMTVKDENDNLPRRL